MQSVQQKSRHQDKELQTITNQISNSVIINTEHQENKKLVHEKKPKKVKKMVCKKVVKLLVTISFILAVLFYFLRQSSTNTQSVVEIIKNYEEGVVELNQTLKKKFAYIKQKLDHNNPEDNRYFFQRIFVSNEQSNPRSNNSVFLYISQIGSVGKTQESVFFQQQIQLRDGISLSMQLRYYGASLPFGEHSFTTQNMKYLSMEQMVEDVAYAINRIIQHRFFGISKNNLWILNGKGFSGTIAAWVRAKYPLLTAGAIVSSPLVPTPLIPITNQNIYTKVETGGVRCKLTIEKIMKNLQQKLGDDRKEATVYQIGQGASLTTEEVLYFASMRISSKTKEFYLFQCQKNETELQKLQKELLTPQKPDLDPVVYSGESMASEQEWKYFEIVRSARAFQYQLCSQLGFFRVYSQKKSFCPKSVDQNYFRKRCKKIFNADLWPNPKQLNKKLDSYMQKATNLMIVHGYYDSYLPYGLKGKNSMTTTNIVKCLNCEGSFDYTKSLVMAKEITEILKLQKNMLNRWLKSRNNK